MVFFVHDHISYKQNQFYTFLSSMEAFSVFVVLNCSGQDFQCFAESSVRTAPLPCSWSWRKMFRFSASPWIGEGLSLMPVLC
jgi:hypothetical protein